MARTRIPLVVFRDNGAFAANAQVAITNRLTGSVATVFSAESGGAPLTQPLTTDARGRCPGWLDRGPYLAVASGTGLTAYTTEFDSSPASDGGIDRAWLADAIVNAAKMEDHAVTVAKMQQDVLPVGTMALWWRPAAGVPLPVKWAEANGQTLVAGQHDFPGVAGSVILPDMRNRHILGANSGIADGTASVAETVIGAVSVAKSPGIGGVQGGHLALVSVTVPGHFHGVTITDPGHSHGTVGGRDTSGGFGVTNLSVASSPGNTITSTSGTGITASVGNHGGPNADSNMVITQNLDHRPGSVGLLVLCKVKDS